MTDHSPPAAADGASGTLGRVAAAAIASAFADRTES
jgi:hypothetical protein